MKPFNYDECMKEHDGYAVTENCQQVELWRKDFKNHTIDELVIIGILRFEQEDRVMFFKQDGTVFDTPNSQHNLFTPSKRIKRTYWVNVDRKEGYPQPRLYINRHHADDNETPDRIACIEITIDCEEGEGL